MSATTDDTDDFDLPAIEGDAASTGAAADSSDWDERLKGLPRLLRYAMLVSDNAAHLEQRLIAEIGELCPQLPHNAAWAAALSADTGLELAAELDRRAVIQDEPVLRSLADCVRLLCLPLPSNSASFDEYRRVGKALIEAFRKVDRDGAEQELCVRVGSLASLHGPALEGPLRRAERDYPWTENGGVPHCGCQSCAATQAEGGGRTSEAGAR